MLGTIWGPRPQETKAFGRAAPGAVLRSRVPNQGDNVALDANTPLRRLWPGEARRVSYYRSTGG